MAIFNFLKVCVIKQPLPESELQNDMTQFFLVTVQSALSSYSSVNSS